MKSKKKAEKQEKVRNQRSYKQTKATTLSNQQIGKPRTKPPRTLVAGSRVKRFLSSSRLNEDDFVLALLTLGGGGKTK
mgnify:CR=1 FL=1